MTKALGPVLILLVLFVVVHQWQNPRRGVPKTGVASDGLVEHSGGEGRAGISDQQGASPERGMSFNDLSNQAYFPAKHGRAFIY